MKLGFVLGCILFFVGIPTNAATLYMDPNTTQMNRGDTIKVSVRLDTDDAECINVVDGVISYSDNLQLVDVSRGQSIMSMWVEDPTIDQSNRTLTFAGGVPNGYCGRIAGDPRLTNVIVDLIFQAPGFVIGASDSATATVKFEPHSQVLLNDGFGTSAELMMYGANIALIKKNGVTVENEWTAIVHNDFIAPEDFSITLERSENAYGNKYFIAFNTTDKQSGIDHYEVIEEPLSESKLFNWGREDAPWVTAKSPYVLKDQSLNSAVRVRAVDKAGNEYIATLIPEEDKRSVPATVKVLIALLITIFIVIGVAAVVYTYIRIRQRRLVQVAGSSVTNNIENNS